MAETRDRLVIVGVGLIGGSIALAAKQRGVVKQVIGVERTESLVNRVESSGVVDRVTSNLAEAVADADIVVVCTPVRAIAATLAEVAAHCTPDTLLTDAGSTKSGIVEDTSRLLAGLGAPPPFVGSHPLAGDHRTGCEAARADLFEGRRVVVTPTADSNAGAIERVEAFWQALGAEVVRMAPADHDAAMAQTSHLPHLVAAALAGATETELISLSGAGWGDTTRIAAGDPGLWRDILMANRECMAVAISRLEERLAAFREAIAAGDASTIERLLKEGKLRRDALGS